MSSVRRAAVIAGIVFGLAGAFSGTAFAGFDDALELYNKHDFDGAIEAARGDKKDVPSRVIMGLSYTERYNIYKTRQDKEAAQMYLKPLAIDVTMQHVDMIRQVLNVPGNPNGNKEAVKLFKQAIKNAKSTPEDMVHISRFIDPEQGIESTEVALAELETRLKPVREYVGKGGTMPERIKDEVFSSKTLIAALVGALAEKKTAGKAVKCLVLIQDPALEQLEEAETTKAVADAVLAVKKAIQQRLKKYPESTWHSAVGD